MRANVHRLKNELAQVQDDYKYTSKVYDAHTLSVEALAPFEGVGIEASYEEHEEPEAQVSVDADQTEPRQPKDAPLSGHGQTSPPQQK